MRDDVEKLNREIIVPGNIEFWNQGHFPGR